MQDPENPMQNRPSAGVPPPPENIKNKNDWASDSGAANEEREWSSLDKVREDNDRRWLCAYGWVLVAITVAFAVIFLLALVTWAWHYLSPTCWHWLQSDQLTKIQSVLFSGGMGAVISGIVRTQISKS